MAFLQALGGDLAGGRAGGVGQRRRVGLQPLRKDARVKQALGEEQQGKAGIDGCGLDGDRQGECIGSSDVCSSDLEASSRYPPTLPARARFMSLGALASRALLPPIRSLAMGRTGP
ncbi:hypothetical protein X766_22300 [Mesorhizobium sp. LSJC255A00]|nr:hypothetical protein X766_22300 [Mesorhizobium sp. LSJC255A00]